MKLLIFSSIILVSGVVDEWNLIHFSKSEQDLHECLKNETNLPKTLNKLVRNAEVKSYTIDRLSHLTHKVTTPIENIQAIAENSVTILNYMKSKLDKDKKTRVKEAIKRALYECSDAARPSNSPPGNHDLPYFVQEIPELATFFNLMLVPSGFYLRDYHSVSFLYDFAERALSLLESALGKLNNDLHQLDKELLSIWNRRARLFYDQTGTNRYIHHIYFQNLPGPYTNSNPILFNQRRLVPHNNRYQLNESTQHYENFKYSFIKILFLGLEIAHGGFIDFNNVHSTSLTYGDVSQYHVDNMWRTRSEFRQYLDVRQMRELSHPFAEGSPVFSSLVRSLREGDRIDGLHLALMFYFRFKSKRIITVTTTIKPATIVPTLVLRAPPDLSIEIPSTSSGLHGSCLPRWSRFERGLRTNGSIENYNLDHHPLYMIFTFNTTGINTLNKDVYLTLKGEHEKSSRNKMSFVNFVEDELKNASSTASEILNQACDEKYYNIVSDDKDSKVRRGNRMHFSQSENWISSCMKSHRLFRCNKNYKPTGIIEKIAASAAKLFSGTIKTREKIAIGVENLINGLKDSYPKFSIEYLIKATIEAALFCSDEKIISPLECPLSYYKYLGQIMLAFNTDIKPREKSSLITSDKYLWKM